MSADDKPTTIEPLELAPPRFGLIVSFADRSVTPQQLEPDPDRLQAVSPGNSPTNERLRTLFPSASMSDPDIALQNDEASVLRHEEQHHADEANQDERTPRRGEPWRYQELPQGHDEQQGNRRGRSKLGRRVMYPQCAKRQKLGREAQQSFIESHGLVDRLKFLALRCIQSEPPAATQQQGQNTSSQRVLEPSLWMSTPRSAWYLTAEEALELLGLLESQAERLRAWASE